MEISTRDGIISNAKNLNELRDGYIQEDKLNLDSPNEWRSNKAKGKSRPVRWSARNIDNRPAIGEEQAPASCKQNISTGTKISVSR